MKNIAPAGKSYAEIAAKHVAWYRQYGRYPDHRIRTDSRGIEYVIGDWSWRRNYPNYPESVDHLLPE